MRAFLLVVTLATGCYVQPLPVTRSAPPATAPAAVEQGVYINGTLLTADDRAQLDALLGVSVPAGRYFVDANGLMGVEGGPAEVDLAAIVRAKAGTGGGTGKNVNMYSRGTDGQGSSIVSDGKCTILSTPSGSITSGNC